MNRRIARLGLIAALVAGAVPALAADEAAEKPRRGGTLRIGAWTEPETLNPITLQNLLERAISQLIFLDPIWYDDAGNWTTPLLTQFPTVKNGGVSDGGRTWTLRLKKGIRWQDGVEVSSADFKFSWERSVDPRVESPSASDLAIVASVDTPDPYTAVFHLKKPSGTFYDIVPYVVPKHLLEGSKDFNRDPFNQKPVGNGPFELTEWKRGSYLVLTRRHDAPPDGPPWVDKIIYQFTPDENARWVQLESGGIDWHNTTYKDLIQQAKKDDRFRVYEYANTTWTYLAFNLSSPILGDHRVREAIARLVNKTEIAQASRRVGMIPIDCVEPPAARIYSKDVPTYPFDPQAAARLLDGSGWKKGSDGMRSRNGTPLVLRLATLSGVKPWEELVTVLQAKFKEAGIAVTLDIQPGTRLYATYNAKGTLATGDFDMAVVSWGGGSPLLLGKQIWDSRSVPPEGSNYYRYKSAAVDHLLDQAEATLDLDRQISLEKKAEAEIAKDLPVLPLFVYQGAQIVTRKLHNYRMGAFSGYVWNAADWWMSE